MSFVTTQPEMLTCVRSMSNARSLARVSHDYPREGAGMDGNRRMERRREGRSGGSAITIVTRLPAVVVLERVPVPALAIARDRIILFASTAFCRDGGLPAGQVSGVGVPLDLPYRAGRARRALWRSCTGESGCGAAAL
jgi:hypothetical protein